MKPFLVWLALAMTVFGSGAVSYHLYLTEHPRRILVAVDTSYPMREVWSKVPGALNAIAARPYTEYSLVTEKGLIHGWSSELKIGKLSPYAPRNFNRITETGTYPQRTEASKAYLITNAGANVTAPLKGWEVIRIKD